MNRRNLLAVVGMWSAAPLFAQPARPRVLNRQYDGEMTLAGNTLPLSLKLSLSTGRNRLVTGQLWFDGNWHGINGRLSQNRSKLQIAAGLPNNQEIRFDGKFVSGGSAVKGKVILYVNGSPNSGGTFVAHETVA